MKEQDQKERVILVDIKLTRGLALVVSVAALIAAALIYLALAGTGAQAAPQITPVAAPDVSSDGMRQFYVGGVVFGNQVKTACAPGYHAASLWEIADPSNLKYNKTLGNTSADSGNGPTTEYWGWVRTGYASNLSNTPGHANCNGWTVAGSTNYGTLAKLPDNWTAGTADLGSWDLSTQQCVMPAAVWCIED
jgi:hypothetical protein